jgi:hypothetical protein
MPHLRHSPTAARPAQIKSTFRMSRSVAAGNGVPDVPAKYDAGINRGLGVPAGFYHFAFEAGSAAAVTKKRDELRAKGVETTENRRPRMGAVDLFQRSQWDLARILLRRGGNRPEGDAMMQRRLTVSRAALELTDTLTKARSTSNEAKMEV